MSRNAKRGRRPKDVSKDFSSLFIATLECYLEHYFLINIGNIPAYNPDPDARKPLGLFFRAEHCADIEKAVRASLHTEQQEDCFDAMLREIAGTAPVDLSFSLGIRVDVVQKVGREFERRRLAPWLYFVRSKK